MLAIRLKRTKEGYSVFFPGLRGCRSQGDTEEEARENIRDAIQEYLAARATSSALQGAHQE